MLTALLLAFSSCEIETEEYFCLPDKVTRTISHGTSATSIIADFKYEGDRLDHVVYSNFQTHYYSYDPSGNVSKISRKDVQRFENLESIMSWEGGLMTRSDEYRIALDRFTQENTDTSYKGYREFEYDGNKLVAETIFSVKDTSKKAKVDAYKTYEYDAVGNLIQYVEFNKIDGDTVEAYRYAYDQAPNPFAELNLAFEGLTYVNNILEREDLLSGELYSYQIIYSPTNFPSQINIRQDNYLVEVVRVDYTCENL